MARIRTIKPEFYDDEKLASISIQANFLYTAMWVFADDKGVIRKSANWIKSKVFPHRENLRLNDVVSWLSELEALNKLVPFEYNGENYYLILKMIYHQRIDKPQPSKIPKDLLENVRQSVLSPNSENILGAFQEDSEPYSNSIVEDSNGKEEEEGHSPAPASDDFSDEQKEKFKKFEKWIKENAPDVAKLKEPFTIQQFVKISGKYSPEDVRRILKEMHNWKPLLTKKKSAYLTLNNWINK